MDTDALYSRFLLENESPLTVKASWQDNGYLLLCHAVAGHANLLDAINTFLQEDQYVSRLKQPMCGYLRREAPGARRRGNAASRGSYWAVVDGSTVLFYQNEEVSIGRGRGGFLLNSKGWFTVYACVFTIYASHHFAPCRSMTRGAAQHRSHQLASVRSDRAVLYLLRKTAQLRCSSLAFASKIGSFSQF